MHPYDRGQRANGTEPNRRGPRHRHPIGNPNAEEGARERTPHTTGILLAPCAVALCGRRAMLLRTAADAEVAHCPKTRMCGNL